MILSLYITNDIIYIFLIFKYNIIILGKRVHCCKPPRGQIVMCRRLTWKTSCVPPRVDGNTRDTRRHSRRHENARISFFLDGYGGVLEAMAILCFCKIPSCLLYYHTRSRMGNALSALERKRKKK